MYFAEEREEKKEEKIECPQFVKMRPLGDNIRIFV